MLEEYLQELSDEGELDSRGAITLDPAKAREKLARSRFIHAAEALLAVVGAALLAGSTRIRILREGQKVTVLSTYGVSELPQLFTGMFSDAQSDAAKELALALNSLFPQHCTEVRVELAQPGAGILVGQFVNAEWSAHPAQLPPDWPSNFLQRVVLLRPSPWQRPMQWLRARLSRLDDLDILRSRTRWSPVPVEFAVGKEFKSSWELQPPVFPSGALALLRVESQHAVLGLPPYSSVPDGLFRWESKSRARSSMQGALLKADGDASVVTIVYRGLTMARHRFKSRLLAFEGVINTEVLDLDASRQQIVDNSRLWNLTGQMRTWIARAVAAWLGQLNKAQLTVDDRRRLAGLLPQLTAKKDDVVFEALRDLEILPVEGKGNLSIRQMEELVERFGGLHVAPVEVKTALWLHGRPLVNQWRPPWSTLANRLRWQKIDASAQLLYWRNGPRLQPPPLPVVDFGPLAGPDWTARLFLPREFRNDMAIQVQRAGEPFELLRGPLFKGVPHCFVVHLDGEFCHNFKVASKRLQDELRAAIWERCDELLEALCASPDTSVQHLCSLVYIFLSTHKGRRRKVEELPSAVRPYPVYEAADGTVVFFGQLLNHRGEWGELVPGVEDTPLQWIKHRC